MSRYPRYILRRRTAAIALVLLVYSFGAAFAGDAFLFNNLSLREGLSNNSVFCIIQDDMGFLWFGTFSGLNRYDGRRVETFRPEPNDPISLSGSIIFDLLQDSSGRIWVGTEGGGLNEYHLRSNTFTHHINQPGNPESISSDKIFCLEEGEGGTVWIGTADSGISVFFPEEESFIHYRTGSTEGLKSDIIRDIFQDNQGNMWVGTQGGGLSHLPEGGVFSHYLEGQTVREFFQDHRGVMWIGLEERGLVMVDSSAPEIRFLPILPDITVRALAEDALGRLWVGTERDGLFILSEDNTFIQIVNDPSVESSLGSNFVRDIFVDASGLVLVGTRGGGVSIYNIYGEGFSKLFLKNDEIRQIYEDDQGRIWIATDGEGIFLYEDGAISRQYTAVSDGLSSDHVYSIQQDSTGILWIGTDGDGLNRLDPVTGEVEFFYRDVNDPYSLSSNVIWSLLEDREGQLWIGTEGGGLNRWDRETRRFIRYIQENQYTTTPQGNSIRTLHEDRSGTLWIGTWDGGLSRKDPGSQSFVNYTRNPVDPGSISNNSINCIAETSEGDLWIGTAGGGINLFEPDTETFRIFRKENGLADDTVFGILPDDSGFLWISTARGLSRFDLITHDFVNFGQSDGLLTDEFSRNAFLRSSWGELFFGSVKGITHFYPGKVTIRSYMPSIRITEFSIFNEPVSVNTVTKGRVYLRDSILVTDGITVYPGDAFIGFTFASLDFADPGRNNYAVMLEGFDQDWHFLEGLDRYYYSSLPPGKYTLRVMGTNSNGVWSSETAALKLTVKPAFRQTWLYYFLLFFSLAGVVALIAGFRVKSLHKRNLMLRQWSNYVQDAREEERTAVSRDVHDELGQLLSALKTHIFWLFKNPSSQEDHRKARYDSMLGIIDTTLDWTKEMASRLRPVVLDNLSLAEAVVWLLEETRRREDFDLVWSVDPTPSITPEKATAIFRILQESLTNIIRHSAATRCVVELTITQNHLNLNIFDNGRGIKRHNISDAESYGIIGMKERTKSLGGSIQFSAGNPGTVVQVKIPLDKETL